MAVIYPQEEVSESIEKTYVSLEYIPREMKSIMDHIGEACEESNVDYIFKVRLRLIEKYSDLLSTIPDLLVYINEGQNLRHRMIQIDKVKTRFKAESIELKRHMNILLSIYLVLVYLSYLLSIDPKELQYERWYSMRDVYRLLKRLSPRNS